MYGCAFSSREGGLRTWNILSVTLGMKFRKVCLGKVLCWSELSSQCLGSPQPILECLGSGPASFGSNFLLISIEGGSG